MLSLWMLSLVDQEEATIWKANRQRHVMP
jgi:hypothetical protein